MVTRTTRIGVRLTAEVGFRIVESIHSNGRQATLRGEPLGITARLATDKEWDLPQFLLGCRVPHHGTLGHRGFAGGFPGWGRDGFGRGCHSGFSGRLAR